MDSNLTRRWLLALLAWLCAPGAVQADVVVLVNRTAEFVKFTTSTSVEPSREWILAGGDLVTVPMRATAQIACPDAEPAEHQLEANSAYFFTRAANGAIRLQQIDLAGDAQTRAGRDLGGDVPLDAVTAIPVKVLVDDAQRGVREVWEPRLRNRVAAASDIFSRLFRVRFDVVAVDTWTSTGTADGFDSNLRGFERAVSPHPARLAIGFTSQPQVSQDGTPAETVCVPLHSHLLLSEQAAGTTEAERLETLIHALGHFLGAVHSPEASSVMRPRLDDGQARRSNYRIAFDPINALAVCLVSEEVRLRNVPDFAQLSPGTIARLRQLYGIVANVLPQDPVTVRYLDLVKLEPLPPQPGVAPPPVAAMPEASGPQVAATRAVLQQIVAAARANAALADAQGASPGQLRRRTGDELTGYYLAQAAQAAAGLDKEVSHEAFLFAIAIGLDHSDALWNNPLAGKFCRQVETAQQRAARIGVLGQPAMHGRRDLLQHFVLSAFLTAAYGESVAEAAGVAKEILDAQGGSGFSFADLAADYAGIAFAKAVLKEQISLDTVASRFTTADYVPAITGLPEGLSWTAFLERFGSTSDERFRRLREEIRTAITRLPAYRHPPAQSLTPTSRSA